MIQMILNLHWLITVLVISVFLTGLGVFLRHLLRAYIGKEQLRKAHDVAAAVYTNVGVVYGLVLGLMAVHGQERWIELRKTSEKESALIVSVGRAAATLNDSLGKNIALRAADYANAVIQTEWEDEHEGASEEGRRTMFALWDAVTEMERSADRDVLAAQTVLDLTNVLDEVRHERIGLMREHIGHLLWVILLGGGILMTIFLVLFAPERDMLHTGMMFAMTLVISTVLMMVFSYEHPTDGVLSLSPEAYMDAAKTLKVIASR